MNLAQFIRYARRQIEMTQEELAEATGLSRQTIIAIENDPTYSPSFHTVHKILNTLHNRGAPECFIHTLIPTPPAA